MARKKKGNPVNGWVILDKAMDVGSTPMVGKVRHIFQAQKAGHAGTLDPFATGLLAIALGEATKTVNFVMDGKKTYRFTVVWGVATDSDDIDGEITAKSEIRPNEDEIRAALGKFIGRIEQIPPIYSAIKINGKRAYDLARSGVDVEMKSRFVDVDDLRLVEVIDKDHAIFEIDCGKGTYIRSIGRDLAKELGTLGHLTQLRRIKLGQFDESHSISLAGLEKMAHNPAVDNNILQPIEAALAGIPALALSDEETVRIKNGQAVSLLRKMDLSRIDGLKAGDVVAALNHGKVMALVVYAKAEIKPFRVLNQ